MRLLSEEIRQAIEAYLDQLRRWGCEGKLVQMMQLKLALDEAERLLAIERGRMPCH